MCNAVSGIMRSDGVCFMPQMDGWVHSHTQIAALHGIPDGEWGDRYARFELTPPDNNYRSDQAAWNFKLDEERQPSWWKEDAPALEDKARQAVKRWLASFPDNLIPGYMATGGHYSTLTGGNDSTLTGGYGSTLTGGYGSTLTGGNDSTLTGGGRSTLTGGYGSTLTGGYGSTLTGGYGSTLTGGDRSTLTGGGRSTLTGGYGSTLTGGDRSTLTGGDRSTLTGGDRSTLTGGDRSTLTGGNDSTLTGGYDSTLMWRVFDGHRFRTHVRYTGEDGIKAGTKYRLENGKVVEVA